MITKELIKTLSILHIEDDLITLKKHSKILTRIFNKVYSANNGEKALSLYIEYKIDLILSDINMPVLDGLELLKEIRKSNQEIPIIFITGRRDINYFINAIDNSVTSYLYKPFELEVFIEHLNNIYRNKPVNSRYHLESKKIKLKRKEEIESILISNLGNLIQLKSKETSLHIKRVSAYSFHLAKKLQLKEDMCNILKTASILHDIGKIDIPDTILNKQGKLTEEEFDIMKNHAYFGFKMLEKSKKEVLKVSAIIAHEHHERWDGMGYPKGIKKEEISIFARITSITDVFDALSTKRVYKEAWERDKIIKFIKSESEKRFDPNIVKIFLNNIDDFFEIKINIQ